MRLSTLERRHRPRGGRRVRFCGCGSGLTGDYCAVASGEAGHVAIEGEIFAVFVMAVMTDSVADVVKEGTGFEEHARLRRKMMSGLQAIEEEDAEFANMLGVRLVVLQAAREAAGAGDKLAGGGVVAMRLFAQKASWAISWRCRRARRLREWPCSER